MRLLFPLAVIALSCYSLTYTPWASCQAQYHCHPTRRNSPKQSRELSLVSIDPSRLVACDPQPLSLALPVSHPVLCNSPGPRSLPPPQQVTLAGTGSQSGKYTCSPCLRPTTCSICTSPKGQLLYISVCKLHCDVRSTVDSTSSLQAILPLTEPVCHTFFLPFRDTSFLSSVSHR